mgnify:CR=1 FL=1
MERTEQHTGPLVPCPLPLIRSGFTQTADYVAHGPTRHDAVDLATPVRPLVNRVFVYPFEGVVVSRGLRDPCSLNVCDAEGETYDACSSSFEVDEP